MQKCVLGCDLGLDVGNFQREIELDNESGNAILRAFLDSGIDNENKKGGIFVDGLYVYDTIILVGIICSAKRD